MIKTVYIHGRPSGHPIHDAYAHQVNADFCFTDHKLRWNDVPTASKLKRTLSWLVCALTFPNRKNYVVFLSEGVREPLLIMKWLKLMRKRQKLMALMANENLYLLSTNAYSALASFMMRQFLTHCDALLCVGSYQTQLAKQLFPNKPIYTLYNGIPEDKLLAFSLLQPNLSGNKLLVIANVSSPTRMVYKGLDLAFESFAQLLKSFPNLELHVVGLCTEAIQTKCYAYLKIADRHKAVFHGAKTIAPFLQQSCLLLQPGRGDSYPTTTIEAAAAGLPILVSEETGTKELVEKVSTQFVCALTLEAMVKQMTWYLESSTNHKMEWSNTFKKVATFYSQAKANENFKNTFDTCYHNLIHQQVKA